MNALARITRLLVLIGALPSLLFVGLVVLLNDLMAPFLARPTSRRSVPLRPIDRRHASLVVLNWNGRLLLEECLPSVVRAVRQSGGDHELIVVDNGSEDDSVIYLETHFPEVKVVKLDRNYYFSGGCNRGAAAAKHDVIVFLNNDMKVDEDFLPPLLSPFSDPTVFAVSSQIFFDDPSRRREETGKTRAWWRFGTIIPYHDVVTGTDEVPYSPAFWFGGGSAAVDRAKFLELGGFDEIYEPFYVEDLDISYQAWKRGWQILFCPESRVYHKHRSSSRRFGERFIERTITRNELLFLWSNISHPRLAIGHVFFLPLYFYRMIRRVGFADASSAAVAAVARLPQCLTRRNRRVLDSRLSDRDVFRIANSPYAHKQAFSTPRTVVSGEPLRVLLLTPYLPVPLHAGGGRMLNVLECLGRRHRISLISYFEDERELDYLPLLESLCEKVDVIRRKVVAPESDPLSLVPGRMLSEFGSPEMTDRIEEALLVGEYDIVQCEYIQMAYAIPSITREATLLTDHEAAHLAFNINSAAASLLARLTRFPQWLKWLQAEVDVCARFDKTIAVTRRDADSLLDYVPTLDIEVIETPVDVNYFKPGDTPGEEEDSIIFVGSYRHSPNVDAVCYFVESVLPLIRREVPAVKFYVVGSYGKSELPDSVQLHPNVVVTDWVEDLRPFLASAAVFAVPVRLGAGIRGKILEAWCMQRPVVSTSLGAEGIDAIHEENLLIADTPGAFAESILALLRDQDLRQKLGFHGRRTAEARFSRESFAQKHEALYYSLLEKKGRLRRSMSASRADA